jgi:Protein of unknown function (DUF1552)
MIVTRKHLSRRTLLRGMGAALSLPLLDSMTPAFAGPAATKAPTRLLFEYIPSGATMADWIPSTEGPDYAITRILKPIEAFRSDFSVLSGLDNHQGEALGDGAGDHARAGAAYLTGVHCKKTGGTDIHCGISVDQIAANAVGSATRFPSLELGGDDTRTVGACDSGYSCAYQNTLSWRTPTSPIPPETNPRAVFERLFGADDFSLTPEERARRAAERNSILDLVSDETKRLQGNLGQADRRKIDEYLFAVREIEKQIQKAENENAQLTPSIDKPAGVPVLFADYLKIMFDLQVAALQTDMTRVITFMYGREASQRTYGEIGIPDPHHPLTHHQGKKDWIEKVTRINVYHVQNFAYLLNKLKTTQDGDGTLLDHVALVYGGGISEGNTHSKVNIPTLVAGRANGRLKPGQHVAYAKGTPVTNLFLTLLDTMDVRPESIGDSTGKLEHLTGL